MGARPQLAEHQIIDQFRQAMADAGLKTDDAIKPDGDLHRFHVEGDSKGSKNGWYVLFTDGIPAGSFGSWKGTEGTWRADGGEQLTPDESRKLRDRVEAAKRERERQERERHEAVAAHAQQIWDAGRDIDGQAHPYLERKGVDAYGLRIGEWPNGMTALLVPVLDTMGKLWSLQAIFANKAPKLGRDKDFLAGGRKRGCFFSIGTPPTAGAGVIVLCEGYATGASIHRATGHFVVMAFDAYNLKNVAYELRRRWPACQLVVAADNDRWTVPTPENPNAIENPGVTFANQLAEAIPTRVAVVVPEFQDLATRPTDFNDLHQLEGLDAVRRQIAAALPQDDEPANDNDDRQHLPLDANVNPFEFPHLSDKGQPLNTPENLAYLLGEYGISCRYNVISKDVEITIPGRDFSRDNKAAANLATITGLCARARMPRENMGDYLQLIADHNHYNPAAAWIESKPWDGLDRIQALTDTLDPQDPALAVALLRRWLIGAAAAVYEPDGVSLQGVLVLQGAQNAGKTSWFWSLVNRNKLLGLEGAQLNPADRDSVKSVISYWLVELGELDATFRKSDIAALKAFITRSQDELFLRYSRAISSFPRRTAFFASVNEKAYLRDETGNRRYWTISCGPGLNAFHNVDMQQVWAQARELYQSGEQYRLTQQEMDRLNQVNEEHQEVSPVEELVLSRFDFNTSRDNPMTATDVLLAIGYDRPNTKQVRECGAVLRKLLGVDEPSRSMGKKVFWMPYLASKSAQAAPSQYDDDRPI